MSDKQERPETGESVQWNPQSGYPTSSGDQPPPPPEQPFPQAPYGQPQPPYGQPAAQPPYGQQPYDPTQPYPQGYPPQPYGYYPGYAIPDHPQATTALVVGLISLIGAFTCLVPILAAPFAWAIGHSARKAIRREPQRYGGESKATAGMVMGIIGTILLLLGILAIVVFVVVAANADTSTGFDSNV